MRHNKYMAKQGQETRAKILETGLQMWLKNPDSVTANAIAKNLEITHGAVLYHFPNGVKNAVASHALKVGNAEIIAQLITTNHKSIKDMSGKERSHWLSV